MGTKIALSFYSGLFAYNGWNYLNFVIPEMKDPVKDLPKAIAISIVLVIVVYGLTNVAFYTTLNVPEVLGSEAVAAKFAEIMYGPMAFMIPIFVAMSTFGGVNGILLTSSRLFYAGACEGQMPEILSMIQVNKNTPAPAVLSVAALSLVYLTSSNIFALIYIIATIFITVVPMIATPVETAIGLGIIATGIPVYFIFVAWKNKPAPIKNMINGMTVGLQKLMVVVPPKQN